MAVALQRAVSRIYDQLCEKLSLTVREFKESMAAIQEKIEDSLLKNIIEEFDALALQCQNKETEIAGYQEYVSRLENCRKRLH